VWLTPRGDVEMGVLVPRAHREPPAIMKDPGPQDVKGAGAGADGPVRLEAADAAGGQRLPSVLGGTIAPGGRGVNAA
jgi:hypothetical protein